MIVAVVGQAVRKSSAMFSPEERRDFLVDAVGHLDNVEVEVFTTLVVDFAAERGATAIVKGLRAISDFEYEFEMNQLNRKLKPEIESVYIFASSEYSFLSSTGVKEMATFGGDVSDLVPAPVAAALKERSCTRHVEASRACQRRLGRRLQEPDEMTLCALSAP